MKIPFNRPYMVGKELDYIAKAHSNLHLAGDGEFTQKCSKWIEKNFHCNKALLTNSCTAALEMAAILADIKPGDEVIMPSFTFVSTANAFVLRGGVPIFVDVRSDTLNLDESLIESALTDRTRAIVPVHYAGVSCEMDAILEIAKQHKLVVIEDAAQGIMSGYKGKSLGSFGKMGCISFHETKNIISGEGGALLVNDLNIVDRAEIIREKGTNRCQFFRGEVDKYTWIDIGSSYLPSEIIAAFLWAQLEKAQLITEQRMLLWNQYHEAFETLEQENLVRRPIIPEDCEHNSHMYYLILPDLATRNKFIEKMKNFGINLVFHYIPLHNSPAGKRYGRAAGPMLVTNKYSECLVRMPLWIGLDTAPIIDAAFKILRKI